MLVLTRKKNESIMIGKDIEVTLLEIEGDRVRIGIEAPREVVILRREVYEDVASTNREALGQKLPRDMVLSNLFPKKDSI